MKRNTKKKSVSEIESAKNIHVTRGKSKDGGVQPTAVNNTAAGVTSKGATSAQITECIVSSKEVSDCDRAISCQKCMKWIHQACANISNQEYKVLEKGGQNLMWFCNMCTGEVAKMLQGQGTKPDGIESTNQAYDNKLTKMILFLKPC